MAKYDASSGYFNLVNADNCGPICQVKKRVKKVKLGIQDYQKKQQQKKLDKLGYKNMQEYNEAKLKAQAVGRKSAQAEMQKAKLQQVQQQEYWKQGGKVGKPQSMFDQIMGGGSKPQVSPAHRPHPRKAKPEYQVHGGKLYQVQQPKVKTKRKNLTKRTKKNGYKKVANFFGANNGSSKKSNKDPFGLGKTDWSFGL